MSGARAWFKNGNCSMFFALLFSTLVTACAASNQYTCPAPIGTIVRDDCDAYKVKYDTMRVNLAAGFSKFKVQTSFADDAMRDPSELIQVMAARMTALCRDFNACHMTPQEYSRRRDELDRTSTAIVALGDQLSTPGLSPEQRRKVLNKLLAMFAPAAKPSNPSEKGKAPAVLATPLNKPEKPKEPKRWISSSDLWFGSVFTPPLPPPVAEGFPRLIAGWRRQDVYNGCRLPDGGDCYRPYSRVKLFGPHEPDDIVVLTYNGGLSARCPVRSSGDGVFSVRCKTPKKLALTGTSYTIGVEYIRAEDDKRVKLGEQRVNVAMASIKDYSSPRKHWGVNHDREMSEGWLFFLPEDQKFPSDFERPYLYATMRYRKAPARSMFPKGSLRCWVDGKPVTPAIKTVRGSGESGSFQDKERYVKTGPHSTGSAKDPFIVWKHYVFMLPYYVHRNSEPFPEGAKQWPPKAGHWTCKIKINGEYLRELEFDVDEKGRPIPMPGQEGKPGDLVFPWWRIEAKILPNNVEGKWSKKAVRGPGV